MKKGILLINLGTPDSPAVSHVRKYLREFLMDRRVIDIPLFPRWILVNLIIAPLRAPQSAKAYKKLWTPNGSPLLYYSQKIKEKWQKELGDSYKVELGMRYQKPSIEDAVQKLLEEQVVEITVVPLYPQYASSTTGSSIEKFLKAIQHQEIIPKIKIINSFYNHPGFIRTLADKGRKYLKNRQYDYILFSYHGLPERHIKKSSVNNTCQFNKSCCLQNTAKNLMCYRSQCEKTTKLLVEQLQTNLPCKTVFQSRLQTRAKEPWLKPYADEVIIDLAQKGVKNILVFSPAFVADCLETTMEIGEEYAELFKKHGGEHLQLVEAVNADLPVIIQHP